MPKTEEQQEQQQQHQQQIWNPPSDRVLIMKAKVKTGWSSRSSTQQLNKPTPTVTSSSLSSNHQQNTQISDAEFLEIEHVMQRAALVEKKEISRINHLYDRFNFINKPKGNGDNSCIVCGTIFGSFSASPKICSMCIKNCCNSCCVDSFNQNKQSKWFCKICSEYYDFLKKSGAWFSQRLPPTLSNNSNTESDHSLIKQQQQQTVVKMNEEGSRSSSNSYLNEDHANLSRKLSKTSINDDADDDDDEIKSSHSTNSILQSSSHSNQLNISNNSINNKKHHHHHHHQQQQSQQQQKIAFDNSSLSGLSDSLSINETKSSHHTSSEQQQVSPVKLIASASGGGAAAGTTTSASGTEEEFKDESIDVHFQKYVHQQKHHHHHHQTDENNIDDVDDILTSTKYDASEVPHSKKRFGSIKSKISSISSSTGSKSEKHVAVAPIETKETSLGSIKFSLLYNSTLQQLSIHLFAAYDLPARDSNGFSDPYVKIHLLPSLAKSTKLRSKTVYKTLNPEFHETLTYGGISITDLDSKTLRLTVLDEDKIGFDYIGEYRVPLKSIQIDEINDFEAKLEEIKELGDDLDTHFRGKINFALKYSKLTQTLFVKIIRCTQLLPMDNGKSSDPFVQIALTPLEKSNHKYKQRTSVKWKTLDPEYMEEFKFTNLDLKTLLNKTIEISVWDKDFASNDFIGVVKLGEKEGGDELTHFYTMIKNPDIYHEQWHTLKLDVE